jgi:hypothetical protein
MVELNLVFGFVVRVDAGSITSVAYSPNLAPISRSLPIQLTATSTVKAVSAPAGRTPAGIACVIVGSLRVSFYHDSESIFCKRSLPAQWTLDAAPMIRLISDFDMRPSSRMIRNFFLTSKAESASMAARKRFDSMNSVGLSCIIG